MIDDDEELRSWMRGELIKVMEVITNGLVSAGKMALTIAELQMRIDEQQVQINALEAAIDPNSKHKLVFKNPFQEPPETGS